MTTVCSITENMDNDGWKSMTFDLLTKFHYSNNINY